MKLLRHGLASALSILLGLGSIAAVQANIVVDGGFETPNVGTGFQTFSVGQDFGAWTVKSGVDVDLVSSTVWIPASGNQSVDLSGSFAGAIAQQLVTVAGLSYTLSFAFAGNPDAGPQTVAMNVYWGGTLIATPTFDTTGHTDSDMGWETLTYHVTASSSSTELEFESLVIGGNGPTLDSVSVVSVPEPQSGMAVFLAVIGLASWKKFTRHAASRR